MTGTTTNASEMAASPHVTAVGGTMFNPQFNGSGNDTSVVGVAPGGIESAWGSSGGGKSKIFPKPGWQSGPGVPNDSARDIPDVSMIAWTPGVFIGADVSGAAQIQCCWGGTSLAGAAMGGILAGDREAARRARASDCSIRLSIAWPTMASSPTESRMSSGATIAFNGVTGFDAGAGYDLVTGWGSVDMTAFASAYNGSPQATPTDANSDA